MIINGFCEVFRITISLIDAGKKYVSPCIILPELPSQRNSPWPDNTTMQEYVSFPANGYLSKISAETSLKCGVLS